MKVYKDQESKRESMAKSSNLAHAKPEVTPKVIMAKKSKKDKKTLLKHSSSFCNENVNLSCRLLKDEGVAFKHSLFSKKKIIMFGLDINYNSHYSVKKLDVYLKTKEGSKKLKGVLGENRYQINADLISNNTIDVIVRLTYRLSSRVTNYKEVKLQRLYN